MPKSKLNFADAFEELEQITAWFEQEKNMDVDEGLKRFERGLSLAASCQQKLQEVENKIVELKKKFESPIEDM